MPPRPHSSWPVLNTYDADHLARVALPLGGIGTGTVSLGGRGDLRDWEIMNRPAKGFSPKWSFFALWTKQAGGEPIARALEGPVERAEYEGSTGAIAANHGLPRFRDCAFAAAYPLGQVLLSDPAVPLVVWLEAFNPMVPADADASGIPVAVMRYVLINRTAKPVTASVCGSLQNIIGHDGHEGKPAGNVNRFKKKMRSGASKGSGRRKPQLQGVVMSSEGVGPDAPQWGTMALATTARSGVTYRTAWDAYNRWNVPLLDFWDDFSQDGKLGNRRRGEEQAPHASLAVRVTVPPGGQKVIPFLLTWHFPNRQTWTPVRTEDCGCGDKPKRRRKKNPNFIGNYYTDQYTDAWDVAVRTAADLPALEKETVKFVSAFCDSDLPQPVKEAALNNLSTLRTQTCFRTPDGRFYGFEGCHDHAGCCPGSCTHVWNYEQGTAFLYGDLACRMREVEFAQATKDTGHMSFRVHLPIARAKNAPVAAADGQMGCLMKLYRDWQLGGDDKMLRKLWPMAKKALGFCWIKHGWDGDRDGVMEGCQHNTMDVEYFGPNPQMQVWYLGALRAAQEMASYLGDDEFAATCGDLFAKGRKWADENLFNGEYYEHILQPPKRLSQIADGLRYERMGARDPRDPDFQLGAGCLVDQLVGQFFAHVVGLGYLLKPANVRKTLRSILKYNFRDPLRGHFNNMRTYALQEEAGLLMASYPRGRRPRRPFPYFNELMTGFEHTAAVGMLQEGQIAAGLKCIAAVRARYDGRKRSPFNEAECGHHYARAMASWAAVLALTGFRYSGVTQTMQFAAAEGKKAVDWFWSTGHAWGTVRQKRTRAGIDIQLRVLRGSVTLKQLTLAGAGEIRFRKPRTLSAGQTLRKKVVL